MEDRETPRMRKYGESKTTRIMMATVPHVISGLGLRKFQADVFLLTRVYQHLGEMLISTQRRVPENFRISIISMAPPNLTVILALGSQNYTYSYIIDEFSFIIRFPSIS